MATFTAQILVGQKHSYDGGLSSINYSLFLSENSRPAWTLVPFGFDWKDPQSPTVTWIPTVENMLEDALLMIGLYVLKDEILWSLANKYFKSHDSNYIELYSDITPEHLNELYEQVRKIEGSHKICLSVYQGSTVLNQLAVLKKYKNDIEVCRSIFTKEYSLWTDRFEVMGSLDELEKG